VEGPGEEIIYFFKEGAVGEIIRKREVAESPYTPGAFREVISSLERKVKS